MLWRMTFARYSVIKDRASRPYCVPVAETKTTTRPTGCQGLFWSSLGPVQPLSGVPISKCRNLILPASDPPVKDFFRPDIAMFASARPISGCPVSKGSVTISTGSSAVKARFAPFPESPLLALYGPLPAEDTAR